MTGPLSAIHILLANQNRALFKRTYVSARVRAAYGQTQENGPKSPDPFPSF